MTDKPLDPILYRNAMSRYAGHVQVVTTEFEGVQRGVTVTAACSVSDSPPSILVCLNNANPSNDILFRSGFFALNTLAAHHQPLATAFAGLNRLETLERFALADWQTLVTGAPVLTDAIVAFDCRLTDLKHVSTHTVLFGEVVGIHLGPANPALLYLDRNFRAL